MQVSLASAEKNPYFMSMDQELQKMYAQEAEDINTAGNPNQNPDQPNPS